MNSPHLRDLLTLPTLITPRRLRAFNLTLPRAVELQIERLINHIKSSIEHEEHTLRREAQWRLFRAGTDKDLAADLRVGDGNLDNTMMAISTTLLGLARGLGRESPIGLAARRLHEAFFPEGPGKIVSLPYDVELQEARRILDLAGGELANEVGTTQITALIGVLEPQVAHFADLLSRRPNVEIDFDEIRSLRSVGQSNLLQAVAMIVGEFPSSSSEDNDARRNLLGPTLEQVAAARERRRRRGATPELEPVGEEGPTTDTPSAE